MEGGAGYVVEKGRGTKDWNMDEVAHWLKSIGCAHCVESFKWTKVTGKVLLQLTPDDLEAEELSIDAADIETIIAEIDKLQPEDANPKSVAASIAKVRAAMADLSLLLEIDDAKTEGAVVEDAEALYAECAELQEKIRVRFPASPPSPPEGQ
jgi:hypothetical protein